MERQASVPGSPLYVRAQGGEQPEHVLTPFDWGLNFTLKHFPLLLQAAIVPALIKVFLRYIEYFRPVTPREAFVIIALDLGTKTWLLVTIMLACIALMQGGRANIWRLGQRALLAMPKVLMSSVALILIVAAFFSAPWMLIFVLFLVWAPFFTAGEIPAKSFRAEEAEDEDELESDYEEERPRLRQKTRFFADKPVWDFGFARSIQFTANRRNLIVTVQLALLLLVALTVPIATVVAIAGYHHDFRWVVFEGIISFVVHTAVLGTACASFLRLLPKEALDEIGIAGEPMRVSSKRSVRLHGKLFPFFLIALLGGLAAKASVDYIVVSTSKPPNLVTKLESMNVTEHQLILQLQLQDDENMFRWLNPLSFRLRVEPNTSEDVSKPTEKKGDETAAKVSRQELLEPQRVMPYRPDGSSLPEENFVPHKGPLRLVLHYENTLKEAPTGGKFVMYYVPLYGDPEPFIQGAFKSGKGTGDRELSGEK